MAQPGLKELHAISYLICAYPTPQKRKNSPQLLGTKEASEAASSDPQLFPSCYSSSQSQAPREGLEGGEQLSVASPLQAFSPLPLLEA